MSLSVVQMKSFQNKLQTVIVLILIIITTGLVMLSIGNEILNR